LPVPPTIKCSRHPLFQPFSISSNPVTGRSCILIIYSPSPPQPNPWSSFALGFGKYNSLSMTSKFVSLPPREISVRLSCNLFGAKFVEPLGMFFFFSVFFCRFSPPFLLFLICFFERASNFCAALHCPFPCHPQLAAISCFFPRRFCVFRYSPNFASFRYGII